MRVTAERSVYSDRSSRTSLSGEPNSASASARPSSVLPTPVGPRNRNEPTGRPGWPSPARPLRTASATASTASSWPTMRRCSSSSRRSSRSRSAAPSSATGMPVRRATIWAMSSAVIRGFLLSDGALVELLQLAGEHHRALVVFRVDGHVARPAQLLDLRGHGGVRRAQPGPGGRAVDQVDRLVGQEAVADVAVGELGRRLQRGVGDRDAVVGLVALAQPAEDLHGLLDRGLGHVHRLEPALQRGVLLDVAAVLLQRGGADQPQLTAGERGLEHGARVHRRALGAARPDHLVQLVDEHDERRRRPR